jgi:hypothetical protein
MTIKFMQNWPPVRERRGLRRCGRSGRVRFADNCDLHAHYYVTIRATGRRGDGLRGATSRS